MKRALQGIVAALASLLTGPLRIAAETLALVIGRLDLPDGDTRWSEVAGLVEDTIQDIADAKQLDETAQIQIRLAVERRLTMQLRDRGLLEEG